MTREWLPFLRQLFVRVCFASTSRLDDVSRDVLLARVLGRINSEAQR